MCGWGVWGTSGSGERARGPSHARARALCLLSDVGAGASDARRAAPQKAPPPAPRRPIPAGSGKRYWPGATKAAVAPGQARSRTRPPGPAPCMPGPISRNRRPAPRPPSAMIPAYPRCETAPFGCSGPVPSPGRAAGRVMTCAGPPADSMHHRHAENPTQSAPKPTQAAWYRVLS